jgi:hypothetical protein
VSIPTWLEYANAIATGTAALLAAGALIQSSRNSNANQKALIRERRIDFELDILVDLAEANAAEQVGTIRDTRLSTRSAMLPRDLLPITRAAVNLESSPEAEKLVEDQVADKLRNAMITKSNYLKQEICQEILEAIKTKLKERH